MRMKTLLVFLCPLLAFIYAVAQTQTNDTIAVVVGHNNSLSNLSLSSLRELYMCERSTFPNGKRAALFSRTIGTPEHAAMLHSIFGMNEGEYKQFWVVKQMHGDTCRVTELPSKGMVIEALNTYPGAIAFVRQSEVIPAMKVVTIDGLKPEDPKYPLR